MSDPTARRRSAEDDLRPRLSDCPGDTITTDRLSKAGLAWGVTSVVLLGVATALWLWALTEERRVDFRTADVVSYAGGIALLFSILAGIPAVIIGTTTLAKKTTGRAAAIAGIVLGSAVGFLLLALYIGTMIQGGLELLRNTGNCWAR